MDADRGRLVDSLDVLRRNLLHQPLHATSFGVYFDYSPRVTQVHPTIPKVDHFISECFDDVGTISPGVVDNITP